MNEKIFLIIYKKIIELPELTLTDKIILSYFINVKKIKINKFRQNISKIKYVCNYLNIDKQKFYRSAKKLTENNFLIAKKNDFLFFEINTENPFFKFLNINKKYGDELVDLKFDLLN